MEKDMLKNKNIRQFIELKDVILFEKKPKAITKEKKDAALGRAELLLNEAKKVFNKDKNLANKYVKIARKICMKHKIKLPKDLKRRFCKHCYSYLVPGKNLRIRNQKGKIVYYCLECKKYTRFPIKP